MCFKLLTIAILFLLPAGCISQTVIYNGPNHNGNGWSTQTTKDTPENQARSKTISDAATIGTAAGMVYLFEIRPEIQQRRNEHINMIEGQYAPVYEMLDSLISIETPKTQAVTPLPKVSGYTLGETWSQFVADSPKLQTNVNHCLVIKPKKESAKKRVYDPCADARRIAHDVNGNITMDCLSAWSAADAKDMVCRDFDGEVKFTSGKLSALKVIVTNSDWKTVSDAMVTRFGPESGMSQDHTSSLWHTDGYDVAISEIENGTAIDWVAAARSINTETVKPH